MAKKRSQKEIDDYTKNYHKRYVETYTFNLNIKHESPRIVWLWKNLPPRSRSKFIREALINYAPEFYIQEYELDKDPEKLEAFMNFLEPGGEVDQWSEEQSKMYDDFIDEHEKKISAHQTVDGRGTYIKKKNG